MFKKAIALFLSSVFLFMTVPAVSILSKAEDIVIPQKMLYIKATAANELMQRASVEVGETYYFSFGLSNTIEKFGIVCRTDGLRYAVDANIQQVEKSDNGSNL